MSVTLKTRNELHLARKVWHVMTVLTMTFVYAWAPLPIALSLLLLAMLLFIPLDFARKYSPELNIRLTKLFQGVMRKNEYEGIAGTTYLLIGVALSVLVFPRDVVQLALLFLAVADPLASYVGIRHGKTPLWGRKSLQGFLAACTACFLLSLGYLHLMEFVSSPLLLIFVAALCGFSGGFAELAQIGKLDDNFTLPVLSSLLIYLIYLSFGIL